MIIEIVEVLKYMDRPNKLLLVGTFRHYFIGLGLALNDSKCNYHLVFINQKFDDERNLIYQASLKIVEPFASVSCLPLRTSKFKQKNINRKAAFRVLREKISTIKPVEIATGNDRRIEFQYAMHFSRNIMGLAVKGSFLDQGTGSYVSFQKINMRKYLARKWIDVPIKKLAYGGWFSRMRRYGESHWTDACYLTHPSLAPDYLLKKECVEVNVDFYKSEQALRVIKSIVDFLGCGDERRLKKAGLLLVLPHSSTIKEMYGSLEQAKEFFRSICCSNEGVYAKYHPADPGDLLDLSGQAHILPSQMPVEILFSVMVFDKVIGDISTSLLSAKWMLPDAKVYYFDISSLYVDRIRGLFSSINVLPLKVISDGVLDKC